MKSIGNRGGHHGKAGDGKMRVLVTGNLGYVGTVLTPMLVEAGHEVIGLDTGYFGPCVLGPLSQVGVSHQVVKDIRDIQLSDLEGMDGVIHLAALSNDPIGNLDSELTELINLRASERLAEFAKVAGVRRFIFASSCSIYGHSNDAAMNEESPQNPLTAYARSKVEFEKTLSGLADDGFSPLSLRNGTAHGFSPRLRIDIVINNLMASAITTGEVKLLSDGKAWRPLVHVSDMAKACVVALSVRRDRWHDMALNVGVEEDNYQIRSLANLVAETVPGSVVTFAEGVSADSRNYNVSFERIRNVLSEWEPTFSVITGIQDLYRRMLECGFSKDDFLGPRYIRLNQLLHLKGQALLDENLRWGDQHGV